MFRTLILAAVIGQLLLHDAPAQSIKIGLSGPFTGDFDSVGVAMRDGARIAVAEINKTGGVMGKQITLVERDDEATPAVGEKVAQALINDEHVAATVGFVNTEVALAAQRYYQNAEIPVMNAAAIGTQIARQYAPPGSKANYVFQMAANEAVQANAIVQEALRRQKFHAPAILSDDAGCAHGGLEALQAALKTAGVTPAAVQTFYVGASNMTVQLDRVKQANADVIMTCGRGQDLARIANSMAILGWKLPLMGDEALSTVAYMDGAGVNADGAMMPQTFIQVGNTPKRARFIAAFRLADRMIRIPSPDAAAQAHDSIYLLKAAIEQARSTEGPRIRAALEDLGTKVEGVVTIYDHPFTPTDHEAISADIPVIGIVRGRHVAIAHEQDFAGDRAVRVKQK